MPLLKVVLSRAISKVCQTRPSLRLTEVPVKRNIQHSTVYRFGAPVGDPENKGGRQLGVNFDTLGTWDNRMEQPINMEESIRRGKPIPVLQLNTVGTATLQGRRKENEDRFKIQPLTKDIVMFAVYDGHGGKLAADYANDHMEEYIKTALENKETDLEKILYNAFIDLNAAFTKFLYQNFVG
jgi:protein phosphatase 1K